MEGIVDEEVERLSQEISANVDKIVQEVHTLAIKRNGSVEGLKDKLRTLQLERRQIKESTERHRSENKCLENSLRRHQKEQAIISDSVSASENTIGILRDQLLDLKAEYEKATEEKNLKVKEMKEIYDAHCQAMHMYKKKLNIYIDVSTDDPNIFTLYFFTTQKETSGEYCVTLRHCEEDWELISLNPSLPIENQLGKHLKETKDIQGFLVCVRNHFKRHRENKTKST